MRKHHSITPHSLGDSSLTQSCYRFLHNKRVNEEELRRLIESQSLAIPSDEELLIPCDTTQINLDHMIKSLQGDSHIGVLGDDESLGFHFHGGLILSAADYSVKGTSYSMSYTRLKSSSAEESPTHRNDKLLEEKESYKWWLTVKRSVEYLKNPKRLTFVFDREGDIYDLYTRLRDIGSNFIVRLQHNRVVCTDTGAMQRVKAYLSQLAPKGTYSFKSPHSEGNRTALTEIRFARITLKLPRHLKRQHDIKQVSDICVLQIKEIDCDSVEQPIEWVILTSLAVTTKEDALKILKHYLARWTIEEVFRGMKTQGLTLEQSLLRSGKAVRNLSIMAFDISAKALKLKQAREGITQEKITEVFTNEEVEFLQQLNPKLEGNTQKLKNPFQPEQLAWGAWIIARLGNWKGYASQRPPGVITMKRGLEKFDAMFFGWNIRDG